MVSYSKGDPVVAVKSFGGFARERIERGTRGTVTETSFFGTPTKVMFHIDSSWGGRKNVESPVEPGEVE
jgi:hypothetical protein